MCIYKCIHHLIYEDSPVFNIFSLHSCEVRISGEDRHGIPLGDTERLQQEARISPDQSGYHHFIYLEQQLLCAFPILPHITLSHVTSLCRLVQIQTDKITSTCLYCSVSFLVTLRPYNTISDYLFNAPLPLMAGISFFFFSAFLAKLVSLCPIHVIMDFGLHCKKFRLIIRKYFVVVNIAKFQNKLPPEAAERFR